MWKILHFLPALLRCQEINVLMIYGCKIHPLASTPWLIQFLPFSCYVTVCICKCVSRAISQPQRVWSLRTSCGFVMLAVIKVRWGPFRDAAWVNPGPCDKPINSSSGSSMWERLRAVSQQRSPLEKSSSEPHSGGTVKRQLQKRSHCLLSVCLAHYSHAFLTHIR